MSANEMMVVRRRVTESSSTWTRVTVDHQNSTWARRRLTRRQIGLVGKRHTSNEINGDKQETSDSEYPRR